MAYMLPEYLYYLAWDEAAVAYKTGDEANHTLRLLCADGTSIAPTNSPTETTPAGRYKLQLTSGERAQQAITLAGSSSTADVTLWPLPSWSADNTSVTVGTNNDKTGYSLDAAQRVKLDASQPDLSLATNTDMQTLLGRLTAARAGYLDNLNVGGAVASQADVNTLNQSASRRTIVTTVGQFERPESGSASYWIEARTYDPDGAAVNADSTPTLTPNGIISGDLSANLSAATAVSTGLYRWTYTVANDATLEAIRFDLSATIDGDTFTNSVHTQVADFVAATFTSSDRTSLLNAEGYSQALYNMRPGTSYLAGSNDNDGGVSLDKADISGFGAEAINNFDVFFSNQGIASDTSVDQIAAIQSTANSANSSVNMIGLKLSGITSLAAWLRGLYRKDAMDATAKGEINTGGGAFDETTDSLQAVRDRGDSAWTTATSVTVSDKTGFKLASDGLDSIDTTAPEGVASSFREMVIQTWRRFFSPATRSATQLITYADDGETAVTTQTISDDGEGNETQGAAS